jgi:hypothetical protein
VGAAPTQSPPINSVHIAVFSREDLDVLEFHEGILVESMFRHRRFIWMSKSYMSVIFFHTLLNGLTSLSDINLARLTRDVVHTWGPQLQVFSHRTE